MKLICSTCAVLFVLIAGAYALAQTASSTPGSTFRDCVDCPQMVVVPAGRFTMGVVSREEEREGLPDNLRGRSVPQHSVAIRQAFAVGKYDVTREEYEMFAAATNRADADSCYTLNSAGQFVQTKGPGWRNPGFTQTSRDPVVCVSWDDAQAYLAWLSQKTGKQYRLLSESEWEYAARAGTAAARYWGEGADEQCAYANGADLSVKGTYPNAAVPNCNDGHFYTSPVGSYRPNAFGLYDMLGNVWQWTADCWNANYNGASVNDAAWTSGDCFLRVERGGSWFYIPGLVRAAFRFSNFSGVRGSGIGFRVARTL